MEDGGLAFQKKLLRTGNCPMLENIRPYGIQLFVPKSNWALIVLLSFLSTLASITFILPPLIILLSFEL